MGRIESGSEDRYRRATDGREVASEIKPLLMRLDDEMLRQPWDLAALKESLVELLSFLVTHEGRTDPNCRVVDLFVVLSWGDPWHNWQELPQPFESIVFDIGGQLHDTFGAPEIAENFESLPEQLLDRAQRLAVDP